MERPASGELAFFVLTDRQTGRDTDGQQPNNNNYDRWT